MMFSLSLRDMSLRRGLLFAFAFGFFLRLLPEILSFPNPIGFDTIYYAWRIKSGVVWYHWTQVFSTWLLYGMLVPVYDAVRGDPFVLLKVAAPLLFGLNAAGVYYFAVKALKWTVKNGLVTAVFFSFQLAVLAISWGFFRNMLGLGVLLFALPWLVSGLRGFREMAVFAVLSVLVVLSHEFASAILLVVVLVVVFSLLLRRDGERASRVLFASVPMFVLLLAEVYFIVVHVAYAGQVNVTYAYQSVGHYRGLFSLMTNYLVVYDTVQSYSSYLVLVSHVLSLFALLYLAVLPLVLVGFFRDRVLNSWLGLLLIGSFGSLVMPFFALDMWSRWMLMLVYPFSFYAVNGVARVLRADGLSVRPVFRWLNWMRVSRRALEAFVFVSVLLGSVFMATPLAAGQAGVFGFATTVAYVPSTMQSNSVPLCDTGSTVRVLEWLGGRMDNRSVLLVHDAFYNWVRLILDDRFELVYFKGDVEGAVGLALSRGFSPVYLVWWNVNIGWYGFTVPSGFLPVFSDGRISAFQYLAE